MGRARFLQRKHRAQSLSFASTAAAAAAKQLWHARYRPPAVVLYYGDGGGAHLAPPARRRRLATVLVAWPRSVVLTPKSSQKPVEAASSSHSPLSSPPSLL